MFACRWAYNPGGLISDSLRYYRIPESELLYMRRCERRRAFLVSPTAYSRKATIRSSDVCVRRLIARLRGDALGTQIQSKVHTLHFGYNIKTLGFDHFTGSKRSLLLEDKRSKCINARSMGPSPKHYKRL